MKGLNFYSCLLIGLLTTGFSTLGLAQTITTGTLSPTVICPGGTVTVTYTASPGSFTSGNIFSAQLSDVTGFFSNPTTIGSLSSTAGGTITATIPTAIPGGSGYRIRVVSTKPVVTGSTSLQTLTVDVPLLPAVPASTTYCEGDAATPLSATATAGNTLKWYGANNSVLPGAPTPDTKVANATSYFVSQVTKAGCEGPKATIVTTTNNRPVTPTVNSPQAACLKDAPKSLTATLSDGGTKLNWYTVPTNGTASAQAPQPPTSSIGTTPYYVSQTQGNCESGRSTVNFTVVDLPKAVAATAPPAACSGTNVQPFIISPDNGNKIRYWSSADKSGTSSATPFPVSNTISATYYVSQVSAEGCDSPTNTPISVTIIAKPARPQTASINPVCVGGSVSSLSATAGAGNTLRWWGTSATGGTSTSSAQPVSNAATNTYYVSQTTKEGCESDRAAILVTIIPLPPLPAATNPSPYCFNRKTRPIDTVNPTASDYTLVWYGLTDRSNGGTPLFNAPSPPTTAVGTTVYFVSQKTQQGCESATRSVTVTVNKVPAPPTGSSPAALCEDVRPVSLTATGAALKWYGMDSTSLSPSSTATVPGTGANFIGTKVYYVTQTVDGCESNFGSIPVRVKDTPGAPGTSAINFCQGTPANTLTASLVANATSNWFDPNGTLLPSAPTPPNNMATSYNYAVSQTLEGCEGPRATLNVRVKPLPGQPGVSPVSFCNNEQPKQLTASGTSLKWYDNSGNLLPSAPVPPTNAVGTQTYRVSQTSSENCESDKATIQVTINALPNQPGVANVSYCQAQPDQPIQNIGPVTASGQNLRWYNPDGNAFPNAPTPAIDKAGTQSFQVTQTVNNCESTKATVQVTINTVAAPSVAKSTVSYCINDKSLPLEATGESGSTLKWVDPYGNMTTNAPTPPTINTNVKPDGDAYFVYQIGTNGCYSPRSTIKVIVNATPTLALQGSTTVNLGLKANLQLKFTGTPPFGYTITGGYTGTSRTADTTIAVLPRGTTTYQVAAVSNGCGLGLPGNPATAIVTVQSPTLLTGALTSTTLCSGASVVVPFSTTGQFNPGNTFSIELASVADTSKKYDVVASANGSPVSGTLPANVPGGAYYVRAKATNPGIGIIGSNSQSVLTVRSRPSATLTGSQTIYEGIPANLTIALGGEGPWTFAYADSLRADYPSVTTSTNPYILEVRPVRTTTYRVTTVINNCGTGPISGTATVTVAVLLGVEDSPLDPFVSVYPVPVTSRLTVDVDVSLTRTPATLSLTDLTGRPVLQQQTRTRRTDLDLSSHPNGIYLLRIQVGDRQTVRKVIKL